MAVDPVGPLKRTPLNESHAALGAKTAPFAGFEMPIVYTGIAEEHEATRTSCAIFDVCHMGRLRFRGSSGCSLLQRLTTIDVPSVPIGRARYGFVLTESGGILDDVILFALRQEDWILVVNAANTRAVRQHLLNLEPGAEFVDETLSTGMVAVQGPATRDIVGKVLPQLDVPEFSNRVTESDWNGTQLVVSTTGYTGEDGVELIAPADRTEALWSALTYHGAVPAGLGARDTLRLEMGYPLHGHELTTDTTPWQAGLVWAVARANGEFTGRQALFAQEHSTRPVLCGLESVSRGIPRAGFVVEQENRRVGIVTSGSFSPSLKKGIALAYVEPAAWGDGRQCSVFAPDSPERRVPMVQTATPFYRNGTRKPSRGTS